MFVERIINVGGVDSTIKIELTAEEMAAAKNETPVVSSTANRLHSVIQNEEKAEAFAEAFVEALTSDDEPLDRKGRYMAKAILSGNLADFLIAVCGWGAESLINIAETGKPYPETTKED